MDAKVFINFYDLIELPPTASGHAIERRFRELARRFHPDNQATGDRARFDAVVEAHETLKDPLKRAHYHEQNTHHLPPLPPFFDEPAAAEAPEPEAAHAAHGFIDEVGIDRDLAIQNNILALLYHRRRRFVREPGLGDAELERLTGCPHEHLEFHLWYLKSKGWIATGQDGLLSITIDGVDRAAAIYRESANKLLTDQT